MRTFRSQAFKPACSPASALVMEADDTRGVMTNEIEHMFFARVDSPQTLLNALSVEIQQQWGVWQDQTEKNAGRGSIRVRHTVSIPILHGQFDHLNQSEQYVLTTKLKKSDGSSIEVPIEATEDALKVFQVLAESGMIKHRYRFPILGTDLVWEADCFVEPGQSMYATKYLPWVKLDIELPGWDHPIPMLPEGFMDGFNSQVKEPTAIQQQIIDEMAQYISLPNPYVQSVYPDVVVKA